MATTRAVELYEEFRDISKTGSEEKARDFLIGHFAEFPREFQEALVLALFEEGAQNSFEAAEVAAEIKRNGLDALKTLLGARTTLEEKLKVLDIKEKL